MSRFLAIGIALSVVGAFSATGNPAQGLDLSDGVSQSEARQIADTLFGILVGCGTSGDPRRAEGHWEVPTELGYAGQAGPPLRIHATSGAITWGESCRLSDPHVLFSRPDEVRCEVPSPAA